MLLYRLLAVFLCWAFSIELSADINARRSLAILLAHDGQASNAVLDFYRATFRLVDTDGFWVPVPISELRRAQTQLQTDYGIPQISWKELRKSLPKKNSKVQGQYQSLQSILDTLVVPQALVVSCQSKTAGLLSACNYHLYDRASSRVFAASRKKFSSGVSDATAWVGPMLQTLKDGLLAAQRIKDQQVIDELLVREDADENESNTTPFIGILGLAERQMLRDYQQKSLVAIGGEFGIKQSDFRAYIEYTTASRSGSTGLPSSERKSLSVGAGFQAKALERLLWTLDLGAGQLEESYNLDDRSKFTSRGLDLIFRIGVGTEISEHLQFDIGPQLRLYYEQSSKGTGLLEFAELHSTPFTGALARLQISY